jgi:SEC-C motif-containing protein
MTLSTAAVSGGDPCPCGTGATYATCCAAYVIDGTPPPTAEALMRSRYVAYVVGAEDHLFRTWHPRTRPDDVSVDEDLRWTGLDLVAVEDGGVDDRSGTVEFVARWVAHGQHGQLQERSTFARRGGRWVYVEATDPTR